MYMPIFETKTIYFAVDEKPNSKYADDYVAYMKKKDSALFIRVTEEKAHKEISTLTNPEFKDYCIFPLPRLNKNLTIQRSVIYVTGESGSGKTWFTNDYANSYHQIYPDRKIYYLTLNTAVKDESLDHRIYHKLDVMKFLESYPDLLVKNPKFFENSFVIFDDIGKLKDEARKRMWHFIDESLENWRKMNTSILVIAHVSTNYRETTLLIKETNAYVVFPKANRSLKSDRVLLTYYKFSQESVDLICSLPSRYVWIDNKRSLIITENQLFPTSMIE